MVGVGVCRVSCVCGGVLGGEYDTYTQPSIKHSFVLVPRHGQSRPLPLHAARSDAAGRVPRWCPPLEKLTVMLGARACGRLCPRMHKRSIGWVTVLLCHPALLCHRVSLCIPLAARRCWICRLTEEHGACQEHYPLFMLPPPNCFQVTSDSIRCPMPSGRGRVGDAAPVHTRSEIRAPQIPGCSLTPPRPRRCLAHSPLACAATQRTVRGYTLLQKQYTKLKVILLNETPF